MFKLHQIALLAILFTSVQITLSSAVDISGYKTEIASVNTFMDNLKNNPDSKAKRILIEWWNKFDRNLIRFVSYQKVQQILINTASIINNNEFSFDKKIEQLMVVVIECSKDKCFDHNHRDSKAEDSIKWYEDVENPESAAADVFFFGFVFGFFTSALICVYSYPSAQ